MAHRTKTLKEVKLSVEGQCSFCGKCCWYIRIKSYDPIVRERVRCPRFDEETNKCELWGTPQMPETCRKFPEVIDFLKGRVPDGCTYYLVRKIEEI